MIRRPPRSTPLYSSAASDVYKRQMYALRFKEEPPERRSVEQLRGIEGVRVRKTYQLLAQQYGVEWKNRNYDHTEWESVACLMLEPGTRVSHSSVVLAARVGCLLVWIGEAGVRLYAAGQPGGARSDRLLYQAKLALDDTARLKVVRKMYA